jgi:hypothetical protein
MATQSAPQLNPLLIFDTLNAYQRTASLKGAIDLELFTAIAEGAATPAKLAARCHASERGIRMATWGPTIRFGSSSPMR